MPFTQGHWEAYRLAPLFPLARGWERQLDISDNHLFYGGRLDAATYRTWLEQLAVRYVAVADTKLDYSSHSEVRLIDGGLPYLLLVARLAHWHVYEVTGATPDRLRRGDTQIDGATEPDARGQTRWHSLRARAVVAILAAGRSARLRCAVGRVHADQSAVQRDRAPADQLLAGAHRRQLRPLRLVHKKPAKRDFTPIKWRCV